jgi:hypothetical protein
MKLIAFFITFSKYYIIGAKKKIMLCTSILYNKSSFLMQIRFFY